MIDKWEECTEQASAPENKWSPDWRGIVQNGRTSFPAIHLTKDYQP
jgi:hypothetical protein